MIHLNSDPGFNSRIVQAHADADDDDRPPHDRSHPEHDPTVAMHGVVAYDRSRVVAVLVHRTVTLVTHLVCITPGRFGAISRTGNP